MKPSARLSIRLALAAICALLWMQTAFAAQPAYHFDVTNYRDRVMAYQLSTTGTIEIAGGSSTERISLEITSPVDIAFYEPTASGDLPFTLTLTAPRFRGIEGLEQVTGPITMQGRLDRRGALLAIEAPSIFAEIGLDMTDLLLGLVVPAPSAGSAVPGSEWQASFERSTRVSGATRRLDLRVTYGAGNEVDWGSRVLRSVTARIRADAVSRDGNLRTEIQEIGHGLFYVQPGTGIPELSSVSVVTQIETRPTTARTPISSSKITLTTTLSLVDVREGAASFAPPQPTLPQPVPPAGTVSGQSDATVVVSGDSGQPAAAPLEPAVPETAEPPAAATGGAEESEATEATEASEGSGAGELLEVPEPSEQPGSLGQPDEVPLAPPGVAGDQAPTETAPAAGQPIPTETQAAPETVDEVATEPVPPAEPAPAFVYRDPAGRFELGLGPEWIPEPLSIGLRATSFASRDGNERAYVYVMPLPSPAATAPTIARLALATYAETYSGFRVLVEPERDQLGGEEAYRAQYSYVADGVPVTEWGLFARVRDRAFYLQYAYHGAGAAPAAASLAELHALRDAFRFGTDPRGAVPAEALAASLERYVDPHGRYALSVPSLWPLTEEAPDGSSVVFTEIGENGYLTLLAEPGARGYAVEEIVAAWKEQWSREAGFELLLDVTPAPLGSYPGVRFDYSWSGGSDGDWSRRLQAAIIDDLFVAVALDYVTPGFAERQPVFDEIVRSFALPAPGNAPESQSGVPADEPGSAAVPATNSTAPLDGESPEPAVAQPPAPQESPGEAPQVETPAESPAPAGQAAAGAVVRAYPFAEPAGDESVILLGRVLTRYPGPTGGIIEAWGSGLEVTVIAGQDEYTGVTDELGYLYVANLPPLAAGRLYTLARLDGPMLGFVDPVSVTFDNLRVGQIGPRVAHLRTLILTLHSDRSLSVDLVRFSATAPDEPSALVHFVTQYPESGWASHVQEVVLSGLD